MKKYILFIASALVFMACSSSHKAKSSNDGNASNGWVSLFDGKTLDGWKFSEQPGTFSVEDGAIKVAGPRSHLFYEGPVMNHDFKNFELKALVMTEPGANSGIYFHTAYQDKGFPDKGFEVQVNNSHTDWKRTAGLYDIQDTKEVYVVDNVWFTLYIKVEGKHVITKINNTVVTDWTQPHGFVPPKGHSGRIIDNGTFALQGHNPESVIFFKDIIVKVLP
jgi:hypothetical protein